MLSNWENTPAAAVLRVLADLMIANLLAILCSIPLVTIGASFSSIYAVMFRREEDEGSVAVIRTFFHAFLENFWKGTLLGLITAGMFVVSAVDFLFAGSTERPLRTVYIVVGILILAVAMTVFLLGFAQLAYFRNSLKNYLKNSFLLAACAPIPLLLAILAWVLPWGLIFVVPDHALQFGFIYMLWGFSFPVWVSAKLFRKVFLKAAQGTMAVLPET